MLKRLIFLILGLLAAQPAIAADWLRGESEHYIIHAKLSEAQLREVVQLAEDYDRLLRGQFPPQTQRGRKLELYLDDSISAISSVSDYSNTGWAGAWSEFASGYVVYDPAEKPVLRNQSLFWALSGNYIDNAFFRPQPVWARTGIRLFYSTAYRDENGAFILGAPDTRRPFKGSVSVSKLENMLATEAAPRTQNAWWQLYEISREAAYPLLIDAEYAGVLERYLTAYGQGSSLADANAQLGDLKALAKRVQDQVNSRKRTFRSVTLDPQPPADITVRAMADDEIALIQPRFRRLNPDEIEKAAKELQKLTERFPQSSPAFYEYAAAEFQRVRDAQFGGKPVFRGFGFSNGELIVSATPYSDAKAWRAVNRALELDPGNTDAQRLKAEIMMNRIVRAGDVEDTGGFEKVRALLAPIAADPKAEPLAAALLHQSYIEQGEAPPDEVIDLLGRAFVANPGVEEFRYAYAVSLVRHGQRDVALRLLRSMLNEPRYRHAPQRVLGQNAD